MEILWAERTSPAAVGVGGVVAWLVLAALDVGVAWFLVRPVSRRALLGSLNRPTAARAPASVRLDDASIAVVGVGFVVVLTTGLLVPLIGAAVGLVFLVGVPVVLLVWVGLRVAHTVAARCETIERSARRVELGQSPVRWYWPPGMVAGAGVVLAAAGLVAVLFLAAVVVSAFGVAVSTTPAGPLTGTDVVVFAVLVAYVVLAAVVVWLLARRQRHRIVAQEARLAVEDYALVAGPRAPAVIVAPARPDQMWAAARVSVAGARRGVRKGLALATTRRVRRHLRLLEFLYWIPGYAVACSWLMLTGVTLRPAGVVWVNPELTTVVTTRQRLAGGWYAASAATVRPGTGEARQVFAALTDRADELGVTVWARGAHQKLVDEVYSGLGFEVVKAGRRPLLRREPQVRVPGGPAEAHTPPAP